MKLLGSIILAFGFAYTCMIISDFHELDQIKGWPTALGMITKSEHVNQDRFHSTDYRIHYEYVVNGQRLSSEEFRLWGANQADFEKYKTGTAVSVRYNPASPSTSFVETDINRENVPKHIIGNILVYIFGVAVCLTKRAPR